MKVVNKTTSICHKCQKAIPARVFIKQGRVWIESDCPEHGKTVSDHVWDDPEIYRGLRSIKLAPNRGTQTLVDITNKCNLNCKICFARANEYKGDKFKKEYLDELLDHDRIFISGGEPTVREDLPDILRRCVRNGQKPVLFSNGIKLADYAYARKLKEAGLRSVLLQLDTLREEDCDYIRGRKLVRVKIKALRNLCKLNIPVSVWVVVVRNRNLKDLKEIYNFVFRFPNVKTVSAIPIWRIGRYDKNDFVPPSEILKELERNYPGLDKREFIETTRLMCNIDRFFIHFGWKRGRIFGACMIKSLVFDYKGHCLPLGRIFNLKFVNSSIEKILSGRKQRWCLIGPVSKLLFWQGIVNSIRNRYFRAVLGQLAFNLRHLFTKKYLLVSPFRFITVGIYPSPQNIDLDFIKACNTYALDNKDHQLRPACLHYINKEKKLIK
ncbi:MAG: radical SAM protein [Candidatus Moranbacteria bacterium]|nr:radical SAM protein [Candidatus Moranbacteria bacterium]